MTAKEMEKIFVTEFMRWLNKQPDKLDATFSTIADRYVSTHKPPQEKQSVEYSESQFKAMTEHLRLVHSDDKVAAYIKWIGKQFISDLQSQLSERVGD